MALVLPTDLPWDAVRQVLEAVPAPAPATFEVVDRYEGAPLPQGAISLTVRVILQPLERTLIDAEAELNRDRRLEGAGAEFGQRTQRCRGRRLRARGSRASFPTATPSSWWIASRSWSPEDEEWGSRT